MSLPQWPQTGPYLRLMPTPPPTNETVYILPAKASPCPFRPRGPPLFLQPSTSAGGQNESDCLHNQSRAKPRAETPSDGDGPTTLPLHPQTLATAEEVAFFDKVKKFIDDKVAYHEFLKLVNLFVQDTINAQSLVERAATFIGDAGDLFTTFKEMMGVDDDGHAPTTDPAQGGMIKADSLLVENTPMLERPKPDLSGPKVKSYGPSYRRLPKSVRRSLVGRTDRTGDQSAMYRQRCYVLGGAQ